GVAGGGVLGGQRLAGGEADGGAGGQGGAAAVGRPERRQQVAHLVIQQGSNGDRVGARRAGVGEGVGVAHRLAAHPALADGDGLRRLGDGEGRPHVAVGDGGAGGGAGGVVLSFPTRRSSDLGVAGGGVLGGQRLA